MEFLFIEFFNKFQFVFKGNFKNKIKDFLLSSTNAKFLINTTINEIICGLKERETFLLHEIDRLVNSKIE